MKKMLALFLSLALLLTFVPFVVSAAEVEQPGNNTLVNKAAAAFPEHAEKLLDPSHRPSANSRDATARVLVVSETRSISDTESITYAEYSDGLILLSGYDFTYDTTLVNSSTGSTYRNITIDIEAACLCDSYNGYFYLDGVSYTLRNGYSNFDSITNPGTPHSGTNCVLYEREDYTANESDTGYARVEYSLGFRIGPRVGQIATSYLTISVGEDTAVVDHLGWN